MTQEQRVAAAVVYLQNGGKMDNLSTFDRCFIKAVLSPYHRLLLWEILEPRLSCPENLLSLKICDHPKKKNAKEINHE